MKSTLIRSAELADSPAKTDVLLSATGKIDMIGKVTDHRDKDIVEADGLLLMPLLIDCHVHFREPGLEHKATMETESASALAGGVGTVCDMPNTIPPTVTIEALADKVRRAEKIAGITIKFFFGVTEATHLATLRELWTGESYELKRLKHHCCGVKLYLDHSTGDQKVDGGIVEEIFKACGELHIPLVAHCEDTTMNEAAKRKFEGSADIVDHSKMRPPESEAKAMTFALGLAEKYKTPFHVAHLSTALGLELVRKAKKKKLPVTCEVAPHHLFLTSIDYKTLGTFGKMNPPLREIADRDALWAGIADGVIDCVSTDHAPHTIEEKKVENPLEAPSGVPGVETMLPLLLSVVSGHWPHPSSSCDKAKLTHKDILRLCFTNPNRIFSLGQTGIVKGEAARLILVDPSVKWTIDAENLHGKCSWTPFQGWRVQGRVVRVIQ